MSGSIVPAKGVPLPRLIAVATVGSVRAAGAVLGAADRVGVCAHHCLHERGQHRLEQVRVGLLQLLQTADRSLRLGSAVIVVVSPLQSLAVLRRITAVAIFTPP